MRAPADWSKWRKVERKYWEEFADDARNVWFGLRADGLVLLGSRAAITAPDP